MADEVIKRHLFQEPYIYAAAEALTHADRPCAACSAPLSAPQHYRTPVELDDNARKWLEAYRSIDKQIAAVTAAIVAPLVERRDAALRNLQQEIGDGEAATVGGRPVVVWAYNKPGRIFDVDRFRKDHPDLVEQYMKDKKAARPFTVVEVVS